MPEPVEIVRATAAGLRDAAAGVCALVRDAVEHGASIGFVLPLGRDELAAYAAKVAAEVDRDERIVVLARDGAELVGMVQLAPVGWPNGRHRADIEKLIVHTGARRRGVATRLMAEMERLALDDGRTLLVLDTITGSEADPLYRGLGYTEAGEIPGYAGLPDGMLAPTTVFFKHLA